MRSRGSQALAAITAAGAAVRLATIDVQSYWFDEALTVEILRMPLGDLLGEIADKQQTPPLYYLIAWPWAHTVGTSEVALRGLSALLGVALVPVAWAVVRELGGSQRAALIAAALCAFNPLLVWYGQEARPYALYALLGGLSLLFFARALRGQTGREYALWSLFSGLAVLTHYFAAFLVVPEGLWLLARARRRGPALWACTPVALVGLALVPLARHQAELISTEYITGISLTRRLLGVPEDFLTGFVIGFNSTAEDVLALVAAPLALLGAWLALTRTGAAERRAGLVAGGLGAVALGVPALLAIAGLDYFNSRNVLLAWLPLAVVPALGFAAARLDARLGLLAPAGLCAVGLASTITVAADETLHRADWRGMADALGREGESRVLAVPPVDGEVSLGVYLSGLRRLPGEAATVSEVAIVSPRNERLDALDFEVRPGPPPGAGFRLVEQRQEETFGLLRWRAPEPTRVSRAALERSAAALLPASALVEDG
jgi:mannosyltransferase